MIVSHRIHILGASGSGTTTLGRNLAARLNCAVFDADDYFWLPSDPPFQHKRPIPERLALLEPKLAGHTNWVLSGSLASWGDSIVPLFTHVVFLTLPQDIRMHRLREREVGRYGAKRINASGDLYDAHVEFMTWAERYDSAGIEQRSRASHEAWLAELPTSIQLMRLDSTPSPDELLESCVRAIDAGSAVGRQ